MRLEEELIGHVASFLRRPAIITSPTGPIERSIPEFRVAQFNPRDANEAWVYASIGAWRIASSSRYEYLITAPYADTIHVETLAMVANFHADPRYGAPEGKVLNIGRPWLDRSACTSLLVSLPYQFGPALERFESNGVRVRFMWLVPITDAEATFALEHGVSALESRLEAARVDTLDADRRSVI